MLAIVAPGQGAQTPGFLQPWLELSSFADRLDWLSAVAGMDLRAHGTISDADTIRDTAIAQPLLVVAGLLSALELFPQPAEAFDKVGVVAGHSVGEITAAAGLGVMSAESAMVFVRERGLGMAEASAVRPTSMAAVVGGQPDEVLAALASHGLTAANNNGSGQVVAAGTTEQLDSLAANLPARTRFFPLSVAGAFHTEHMAPAQDRLAHLARSISTHDPRSRLLSNKDGLVIADGREYLNRMVGQVANPVRWDLCMETMKDLGVTGLLEVTPAGTLTGIAKRNLKGVELFNLNSPEDLDAARVFVDNHGEGSASVQKDLPTWVLVVAPAKGAFHRAEGVAEGAVLPAATPIGTVANVREDISVTAAHGGEVVEWLVEDGDPVSPGQPLLRIHPAPDSTNGTDVSA